MNSDRRQRKINALHGVVDFLQNYDPNSKEQGEVLESLINEYLEACKEYTRGQCSAKVATVGRSTGSVRASG